MASRPGGKDEVGNAATAGSAEHAICRRKRVAAGNRAADRSVVMARRLTLPAVVTNDCCVPKSTASRQPVYCGPATCLTRATRAVIAGDVGIVSADPTGKIDPRLFLRQPRRNPAINPAPGQTMAGSVVGRRHSSPPIGRFTLGDQPQQPRDRLVVVERYPHRPGRYPGAPRWIEPRPVLFAGEKSGAQARGASLQERQG